MGIIQGLLHAPKLIILDEPTGGLDPLMQQTFFDILREENRKGVTILFSSHILSEVQKMADRIGIIKDGTIISVESMEQMRKEAYKKVTLTFDTPLDAQRFALPCSEGVSVQDSVYSCVYHGEARMLVSAIANQPLVDVNISEPDLEEVFMHYYVTDTPAHGAGE